MRGADRSYATTLTRPDSRAPLRLLLVTDGDTIPTWLARCAETVERSGVGAFVLILQADSASKRGSFRMAELRQLLYRLYARVDRLLFRRSPDAHTPIKLQRALPDRRMLDSAALPEADRLDVVLDPFGLLPPGSGQPATFGVWSVTFGQSGDERTQSTPGFWEVVEGRPSTETRLCIRRNGSNESVSFYVSVAPSDRRSTSRSQNHVYWKIAAALASKLQRLWEDPQAFLTTLEKAEPFRVARNPSAAPGNLDMVRAGTRLMRRLISDKCRSALYREQWALAYRNRTRQRMEPGAFHRLIPPPDRFWADPFPVRVGNDHYIFHEELRYATGKGSIVLTVLDATGGTVGPIPILERDHHLSYPFVFEWDGEFFMMPESAAQRQVELYRCVTFPTRWKSERVLLRGVKALDPTAAFLFGRWWLFANVPAYGSGSLDELHLFHADSPLGPWTPHRANPIKSDVRSARPAGRIFESAGQLFRPAQDCSTHYGAAVVINRILALNPETYEEVETARLGPNSNWGPHVAGVHTFNATGDITLIDCLLRSRRH